MNPEPEFSPEDHEAEIGAMPAGDAMQAWEHWQKKQTPENLAAVLRSVRPVIDRSVSRFPRYNPAVLGGEARRLAIMGIRSFSPDKGVRLTSHLYNHLKPLGRFAADLGPAVHKSRLERDRTAEYLGAVRDLTELHNREPSDEDLQDYLHVDRKTLAKMRQASSGEAAEGQLEYLPGDDGDPRLSLWTDYVYHDLRPQDKLIMDYKMGRNGRTRLGTEEVARKLGLNPDYVNRRAGEIAHRILEGANTSKGGL